MSGMGAESGKKLPVGDVLGVENESWSRKLPSLKAAETREVNSATSTSTAMLAGVLAIAEGDESKTRGEECKKRYLSWPVSTPILVVHIRNSDLNVHTTANHSFLVQPYAPRMQINSINQRDPPEWFFHELAPDRPIYISSPFASYICYTWSAQVVQLQSV